MSVLTKKQSANGLASKTMPLTQAAVQAQQAALRAKPLAQTAGTSIRHTADDAVAWATPKVDAARTWAAPQLEQSARTISENLAPMISSALITAAHKIEVPKRRSRQRRRLMAGSMLLAVAAGLAAALTMRLRQHDAFPGAGTVGVPAQPGSGSTSSDAGTGLGFDTDDGPDPDMNGQSTIT